MGTDKKETKKQRLQVKFYQNDLGKNLSEIG